MRIVLALAAAAFAVASYANDVGQIKNIKGSVHLERDGKRLAAAPGMGVKQSDVLVTGADGSAGVTFQDNSLLSIGPGSELAIEHYSFDSTTHAGRFDASLKRGTLGVVSGRMVKQSPEAMRVRTPSSIMGVRGTEFLVKVAEPGK
jgi:hypothetical protein